MPCISPQEDGADSTIARAESDREQPMIVWEKWDDVARRIEAAEHVDEAIGSLALEMIDDFLKGIGVQPSGDRRSLVSTDQVLHLVDQAAPGWSIHLDGKAFEPNGHWRCTLRPSDMRDDDEFIAVAKGPRLVNVLVAALLRLLAHLNRA